MVETHIKSLLYDHDCVIIPEFGGLITRYVSARINPVKHTLTPPSKKIAFNEKLVLNDGLLISTIAYRNNVSKEVAQRMVTEFVHQAKATLHTESKFELRDVGVFRYNQERKLEFEYVAADNMLEASFGLPDLVARPIRIEEPAVLRTLLKERQQEPVHVKQPLRKRLKRAYNVAAGLALTGLTMSALYFLSLQTDYNLSSLNPIMLVSSGFNTTTAVTADKYTSDYVPFTEEERYANYQAILPVAAETNTVEAELATEEEEYSPEASETLADSVQQPINEVVANSNDIAETSSVTNEPVLTIKGKTGRFYIITGGYSTEENAGISRAAIRQEGHDSKVLLPGKGSKLFRVSVADFETAEEAHAALANFRKSFGETIWVFNY
ncbi:SPOR domain-containing protein [Pontibacter sp. MBLB2868]|uniref:HU domain-containing protein n=1 Tax=Pontibacter sp. MBLB2868 TaxID=3451555 RepID=UPI003F755ECF